MSRRRARGNLALFAVLALADCSGRADGAPGVVHSITVQPQAAALCVGDSLAFTARALDGAGHDVATAQIAWSSSAPEVVSIDKARGVARALAVGATRITASAGGVLSAAPAGLDVPADLVPEFVPDSAVLAPGDTMTLGVRLRRLSSGPVPNRTPVIAPFDSAVAKLDATGLVTAKAGGRVGLSLSACGHQGGGAVDVFAPPDSTTGQAFLWVSGATERRARLPAQAINFTLRNGRPAFQIVGPVNGTTRAFVYEDTVALTQPGLFPLDSLKPAEVGNSLFCVPPRPFAFYFDSQQLLLAVGSGSARVTRFVTQAGFTTVSGRMAFRVRDALASQPDTLTAIYTFSAALTRVQGACP